MATDSPASRQKKPSEYINHPEVLACIQKLKEKFGDKYERLIVSDTLDDEGHQMVLVQKRGRRSRRCACRLYIYPGTGWYPFSPPRWN